jgi:hypothetical protein
MRAPDAQFAWITATRKMTVNGSTRKWLSMPTISAFWGLTGLVVLTVSLSESDLKQSLRSLTPGHSAKRRQWRTPKPGKHSWGWQLDETVVFFWSFRVRKLLSENGIETVQGKQRSFALWLKL